MKVALSSFVDDVALGRCQHLTARLYGYSSWHELQKAVGVEVPSLDDSLVDNQIAASRRLDQIDSLVSDGIEYTLSTYLIETLHPTRASFDMSLSQAGLMEHMASLAGALGARRISLFCHENADGEIAFYEVERGKPGKDAIGRPALAQAVRAAFGIDHRTVPNYQSRFVIRTCSTDYLWRTMWTDTVATRGADDMVENHSIALFSAVRNPMAKESNSNGDQRPDGLWLPAQEVEKHNALTGTRSY
jgi:hypothetical protein